MEIKIIKEEQNSLFNRKEIQGEVKSDIVPSKKEIADNLSKKYSVPANAIRIMDIKGKFGIKEFNIRANIYSSPEEKNNVETLSKKELEAETKTAITEEKPIEETSAPVEEAKPTEENIPPAQEAIGINPVEESKKLDEKREKEDKKEKDKSTEEKLNETELQA